MAYASAKNGNQDLSILLRSGVHGSAGEYFALKADSFAVSYSKTPIQVPIPESSPELIDLGIFRPSITINGIVDTTQPSPVSITVGGQTYVIPFKNQLENAVYNWIASDTATGQIEIEVGDRFQLNPSREDRYDFSMQFVAGARQDWIDQADLI